MMNLRLILALLLVHIFSCSTSIEGTFNSQELVSSKGEKIYINSLNWGMTDDNQISLVTGNSERLKERNDTIDVIYGLEPFIYRFENDTLKLFFDGKATYSVSEKFETISLHYVSLDKNQFAKIRRLSYNNSDGYYSVPKRKKVNYPSDMPKPPNQQD